MKGRTQIIQNMEFCCVEHKEGAGSFFTEKIIVLRTQESRSVFVKSTAAAARGEGDAWVGRGQPDRQHPGYLCTRPGTARPPAAVRRDTPAEPRVQLLATQRRPTDYLRQKQADAVVRVLLSSAGLYRHW